MKTDKCGYITLVGRANTGKSTLLNTLIGEKLSIVTSKPQTTRDNIRGILTHNNSQFVFLDTPGIHKPSSRLNHLMVKSAYNSLDESDIVVLVALANKNPGIPEKILIKQIDDMNLPCVLALNKSDIVSKSDILPVIAAYSKLHNFGAIIPLSAKSGEGCDTLLEELDKLLPTQPHQYSEKTLTDLTVSKRISEIVREKLMDFLKEEIPHGIACKTERIFYRDDDIAEVDVLIVCDKNNHKNIIIGKQGSVLKDIGTKARVEIENLLCSSVFLSLWVKVKNDWRNSPSFLTELSK